MFHTGCDHDAFRRKISFPAVHRKAVRHGFQSGHRSQLGFHTEVERLIHQLCGQRVAADLLDAGIVLHPRRIGNLPTIALRLQQQHTFPRPRGINCGGHAGRAGADDNNVMHVCSSFRENGLAVG